ncbi:hypothetical protein [Stappia sp.]|uniref:hypothetical protein n=1 Tax=Stappia sp. TaxID=1870903 RepID=UPI0032D968C0
MVFPPKSLALLASDVRFPCVLRSRSTPNPSRGRRPAARATGPGTGLRPSVRETTAVSRRLVAGGVAPVDDLGMTRSKMRHMEFLFHFAFCDVKLKWKEATTRGDATSPAGGVFRKVALRGLPGRTDKRAATGVETGGGKDRR